ncbi:P-loop containing nucleoside triphosphate hydrolase protein [Hysterangium stoloniferum]|nr:P-loop containing nucleoside triphosphate hydrolase protein [Hysterangium stoloniferum]
MAVNVNTSSLAAALDTLGFGPYYHMWALLSSGRMELSSWFRIFDEGGVDAQAFDSLFQSYRSVLDQPPALLPQALYSAYPNAKFILTVRNPEQWAASMRSTLFPAIIEVTSKTDCKKNLEEILARWDEDYLLKYHNGRLFSHPEEEFIAHNERVKNIIPEDKLLIYNVEEGWGPLAKFLDVEIPNTAFPHLNDSAAFNKTLQGLEISKNVEDKSQALNDPVT